MCRRLTGGLLVAAILIFGMSSAAWTQTTWHVNPGDSIQAAIDGASPGDTIDVAAGTYAEYLHVTTDNLTIQGAGIDQSIIDHDGLTPYWHYGAGSSSFASRAGVYFVGYGSPDEIVESVTFRGFTVKNTGLNVPITAGWSHADSDNAAILTDSMASWTPGALVGQWVHNLDDRYIGTSGGNQPIRSYGQITANTATTVTATLAGGMEDDWDIGDTYTITPYEHFLDSSNKDGQDDIPGIGVANGKNVVIEDVKVQDSGSRGISVGKARCTSLKQSENMTVRNCIVIDNPSNGISINDHTGTITITDNTVSNNKRPHESDPTREYTGIGIYAKGASSSKTITGVISGNTVSGNGFEGIVLYRWIDGVIIENNTVTGHNFDQDGAGIFFYYWGNPDRCKNITVRGNTVTDNIRGIVAYYASHVVIEDNTITTDSGAFAPGQAGIKLDYAEDITVLNNLLGTAGLLDGNGIRISGGSHDNTITGNTIQGADFLAIYLSSAGDNNACSGNTVDGATLAAFGIRVAGINNTFTGNTVTSTPWLWYTNYSIQTVLDGFAADGDSIYVASGTYSETVTFATASGLTIHGDNTDKPVVEGGIKFQNSVPIMGVTIENLYFKGDAGSNKVFNFSSNQAVNNFTLQDCVIDGEGFADRNGIVGNKLAGALTIKNCEFKDIYGWALCDLDGSYSGPPYGGNELVFTSIEFANNHIHDCDGSVALRGNHITPTAIVNVYGNLVENIGGNDGGVGDQWAGIEINHAAEANVYGNTINDVEMGQWEGQGFQFFDIADLRCGLNVITNNAQGIWIFGGGPADPYGWWAVPGGIVTLNKIEGNTDYGISVDTGATGGPLDATANWWGSADGPTADHDADGTPEYLGGGDKALGNIIYSPWLGVDPDGDPNTPGVQLLSPLYIIVDDVGPIPGAKTVAGYVANTVPGYLNRAIGTANTIAGVDTIEVRHGTYDASEPITEGVNIVSEVGSATHTILNGAVDIRAADVLLGRLRQGFRINGPITVGAGVNASTIHINWNDIYDVLTNSGDGLLDATFNFWDDDGPDTVGWVNVYPFLPETSDTIIGYMDGHGLSALNAIDFSYLLQARLDVDEALIALGLMKAFGFSQASAMELLEEYGMIDVAAALRGCHGDYEEFLIGLLGYGVGGGSGGGFLGAGGGGAVDPDGTVTFTVGDVVPLEIQFFHPVTGEPVDDAVVSYTVCRTLEDGTPEVVAFGVMAYNADVLAYVFDLDTFELEPGVYDIYLGAAGGGYSQHVQITVVAE